MPDPIKYERDFSFEGQQAGNPTAPQPGIRIDDELDRIAGVVGGLVDAVKNVRRSDGKLQNASVGVETLSALLQYRLAGKLNDGILIGNADTAAAPALTFKANVSAASAQPADVTAATVGATLSQRVRPALFSGADLAARLAAAALSGFVVDLGIDSFPGITTFPGSDGRRIAWAHGFYNQGGQPDPMPQTAFAPAYPFPADPKGLYSYAYRNGQVTGYDVYSRVFPNVSSFDVVQAVLDIAPGTLCHNMGAMSGYVRNRAAATQDGLGSANGVGSFVVATAEVDNAAVWGGNWLLQDSDTRAAGTALGRRLTNEFDFNVMNPGTQVIGLGIGGNSLAQPINANGFVVNPLGTGFKWNAAFWSLDGAAKQALIAGALETSGTNISSQVTLHQYFDGAGVKRTLQTQVRGGFFTIEDFGQAPFNGVKITKGDMNLDDGQGYRVAGLPVVGARRTGWVAGTGAANRGTFDANYLQSFGATYAAAEGNALASAVRQIAQRVLAVELDLRAHGLING